MKQRNLDRKALRLSSKNQITIPAAVRRQLRVRPGDHLEVRIISTSEIELRKSAKQAGP